MAKHSHRPSEAAMRGQKGAVLPWVACVTPAACAASPERQRAHGGHIQREYCSCGSWRELECNGGAYNAGPWRGDE